MSDCFDHGGDAWDDLCFGRTAEHMAEDDFFGRQGSYTPYHRVCNLCGVQGLVWREVQPSMWRLYDASGEMHICNNKSDEPWRTI